MESAYINPKKATAKFRIIGKSTSMYDENKPGHPQY